MLLVSSVGAELFDQFILELDKRDRNEMVFNDLDGSI